MWKKHNNPGGKGHIIQRLRRRLELEIERSTRVIRESQIQYQSMVDQAVDLIYQTDANGIFTYINSVAHNKLGYRKEDIIGRHFTDFIDPEYREAVFEYYFGIRASLKEKSYYELPILSRDGERIWIGQNLQLILENGKIKHIFSVARDITQRKQTEEALHSTQRRLVAMISSLQSAAVVEDEDQRLLLLNQHFCDLFELNGSPQDLMAREGDLMKAIISRFTNPDKMIQLVDTALTQQKPTLANALNLKDGKTIELDYIPIFSEEKYLGHLWNFRDVTEKRQTSQKLKQSEEKYRGLIENMQLGLLEVNAEDEIVFANNMFSEISGYPIEEIVGSKLQNLLQVDDSRRLPNHPIAEKTGKGSINEVYLRRKDGSHIWVLASHCALKDDQNQPHGFIEIYYDITQRKELEQDLANAKKAAEEAQEVEQQFLARMSHEIRTPLNAIIGMSHLLYDTAPTKEQCEYLSIVKSSADLLKGIISNILDFSKIQSGEYKVKQNEFDLVGLVGSMVKTFQLKAKEQNKQVYVRAAIDHRIRNLVIGDDLALNQILMHLMENAFKFTEHGGFGIQVKLLMTEGGQQHFEFRVKDTGVGIAQDQLDLIFHHFKQLDKTSEELAGGTGLGLAITKQLVELLGGKIRVTSGVGKGTEFVFNLILKDSGVPSQEINTNVEEWLEGSSARSRKILVAEDNAMNQRYISSLLDKWSIPFVLAGNGKIAVEKAMREPYDLILMDISMPLMDGFEATSAIKCSNGPNMHTPVVALTASALVSTQQKAFGIGMSEFLTKPFKPFQLQDLIEKYLGHAHKNVDQTDQFCFNERLDQVTLKEMYAGDLEYAIDIFEIFLEHTLPEMSDLQLYIRQQDWKKVATLAHKLKPNFTMVGLTHLEEKMLKLEMHTKNQHHLHEIPDIMDEIVHTLEEFKPILKEDLSKMKSFEKMV